MTAQEAARTEAAALNAGWEDYAMDTTLAEVEHGCREILDGVEVLDEETL